MPETPKPAPAAKPAAPSLDERLSAARAAMTSAAAKRSPTPSRRVTFDGIEVELRPPDLNKQQAVLRAAGLTTRDAKETDWARAKAVALVEFAYLPGTDARVLDQAHIAGILTAAVGSPIDVAADEAVKMLNVVRGPGSDVLQEAIGKYLAALDASDADAVEAAIVRLREVHGAGKA